MTKAPGTPSYLKVLTVNAYVGGVRRDKPRRCRGRISPSFTSFPVATGILGVALLAAMPRAGFAADAAPVQASPAQALPNPGSAPRPPAHGGPVTGVPQAPQIQGANPAAPQVQGAQSSVTTTDSAMPPKKRWPGPVQLLSPSAPLNRKSSVAIGKVHKWQARNILPTLTQRGEVVFIYGATQDTVIGAPNHISDIALQPGEIVQNINLGDTTMWSCPPAISGSGATEITHLLCKPADAGLNTNMALQTSRRTYSIELKSTRNNYMPRVKWSYPEDQAAQWAAYQQHGGGTHGPMPTAGYIRYAITGDNPPWRPFDVYSDGQKTYVRFPPAMAYGQAPVLERLP